MKWALGLGLISSLLGVACSSTPATDTGAPEPDAASLPRPERPAVDELSAMLGADGALGVVFAGRMGLGPARVIEVALLDEQGEAFDVVLGWFPWVSRPNRFMETASVGHIDAGADTFRGFTTLVDASLTTKPRRVRVRLGEQYELLGEPREADVKEAAPLTVQHGARCDPFEVVNRCETGELCDAVDGVVRDSPTCQAPSAVCPLALPALEGSYEGSSVEALDATLASCTRSRGNLGREQGHTFTAPSAGTFRFVAESVTEHAASTLFVRRYCDYAHAAGELGCAHEIERPGEPLELEVSLDAREVVYVFVESWWAYGGDYVLSVEPAN